MLAAGGAKEGAADSRLRSRCARTGGLVGERLRQATDFRVLDMVDGHQQVGRRHVCNGGTPVLAAVSVLCCCARRRRRAVVAAAACRRQQVLGTPSGPVGLSKHAAIVVAAPPGFAPHSALHGARRYMPWRAGASFSAPACPRARLCLPLACRRCMNINVVASGSHCRPQPPSAALSRPLARRVAVFSRSRRASRALRRAGGARPSFAEAPF